MQCTICGSEFQDASKAGICPACRDRLRAVSAPALAPVIEVPAIVTNDNSAQTKEKAPAQRHGPPPREIWRLEASPNCNLLSPMSVAVHPSGEILVLDEPADYRVLRVDRQGRPLGSMFEISTGEDDGQIDDPQGLCIGKNGQIYIPEAGNDRISIWDSAGNFVNSFGGTGSRPGQLARPRDVDVDADGFIYVADTFNHRIQKFSPDGLVCMEITDLGAWGTLREPVSITTDSELNVYVIDGEANRLVKLSADGAPVACIPRVGQDDQLFDGPGDVRISGDGTIYVADRRNLRIRRFAASGELLGTIDLSSDPDATYEAGDIALLDDYVLVPDSLNDRLLCVTFGK
jgi:DNA-binding beta-propeller fold protein YncE